MPRRPAERRGFVKAGDVWAIPEGRIFFKDEPILEVSAPVIEAQIVETFIINQLNLQIMMATKAARCVHAAGGRSVVDFSLRRTAVGGFSSRFCAIRMGISSGIWRPRIGR